MAQFNFILNGENLQIKVTANSWNGHGAWGHSAQLFINGRLTKTASIRYYNRTWESYQYQSAKHSAVWGYIHDVMDQDIIQYKRRNRLSRLPNGGKRQFEKFYQKAYDEICTKIDNQDGKCYGGWTF